jgi:hypothetical protein
MNEIDGVKNKMKTPTCLRTAMKQEESDAK